MTMKKRTAIILNVAAGIILNVAAGIFTAVILIGVIIYSLYQVGDSDGYKYQAVNPIMIEILGDYNMSLQNFGCQHGYEFWCINWNKEHNKSISCWEQNGVLLS
jgi:hypothetical protein